MRGIRTTTVLRPLVNEWRGLTWRFIDRHTPTDATFEPSLGYGHSLRFRTHYEATSNSVKIVGDALSNAGCNPAELNRSFEFLRSLWLETVELTSSTYKPRFDLGTVLPDDVE